MLAPWAQKMGGRLPPCPYSSAANDRTLHSCVMLMHHKMVHKIHKTRLIKQQKITKVYK